jgi:hypothetical protein
LACTLALLLAFTPITTVPSISTVSAEDVPEQEEPTYSTDEQVDIASSTRTLELQLADAVMKAYLPKKEYTPEQIELVILVMKTFNDPVMVRIAWCESGLNALADRSNLNVDVGLFQINQVHNSTLLELGLDRRNVYDNTAYAKILYDERKYQPWYMSQHCWRDYVS